MTAPDEQVIRQQRFIQDHPGWVIHPQYGPRFTAEKDDGTWWHIVARPSLKGLLDRLAEIEAGR
jgi:hypothetical protein